MTISPEAAKALEELAELALRLKKTGLLDLLAKLADEAEELLRASLDDRRLFHALAAVEAGLNAFEDVDPWRLKPALAASLGCALKALDPEVIRDAKPVGLVGLLRALRDPDVRLALGIAVALAKAVGSCLRRGAGEARKALEPVAGRG